ncbi:hypothetical protein [Gottfriedia acidiceleris]|uniref:hypothetical protein n=1 Tax=Gottfriedia acidiceleris TaxID=371036 RepID=UPI002FFE3441
MWTDNPIFFANSLKIFLLKHIESIYKGAKAADGVIHLAFNNDFSDFANSLKTDLNVIETIGRALEGTGKAFVTTAHYNGTASDNAVIELGKRAVRTSIVSLAPSVHGPGGFLVTIASQDIPRSSEKTQELLRWRPTQ